VTYTPSSTEVTNVQYAMANQNFLMISLGSGIYPSKDKVFNYAVTRAQLNELHFFDYIEINGKKLSAIFAENDAKTTGKDNVEEFYINLWTWPDLFGFRIPGYTATTAVDDVTFLKGCQFPDYYYLHGDKTTPSCWEIPADTTYVANNGGYVKVHLPTEDEPAILDDSFSIDASDAANYLLKVRINRTGAFTSSEEIQDKEGEHLSLNGHSLKRSMPPGRARKPTSRRSVNSTSSTSPSLKPTRAWGRSSIRRWIMRATN
jgi:hypothetical protein